MSTRSSLTHYIKDTCPHGDHDHGICLDCGEDITDQLVSKADDLMDLLKESDN